MCLSPGPCRTLQLYLHVREASLFFYVNVLFVHFFYLRIENHNVFITPLLHSAFVFTRLSFAARSRIGVANMARQRVLTVASPGTIVCSSVSESSSIISPMHTSHGILSHSTPLSSSAPLTQAAVTPATQQQIPDVRLNTPSQYPAASASID